MKWPFVRRSTHEETKRRLQETKNWLDISRSRADRYCDSITRLSLTKKALREELEVQTERAENLSRLCEEIATLSERCYEYFAKPLQRIVVPPGMLRAVENAVQVEANRDTVRIMGVDIVSAL